MALYIDIKPADDPNFVLLRTSASPAPERKPPLRIRRDAVDHVLAQLLGAANVETRSALHGTEGA